MKTYQALRAQIDKLEKQAETVRKTEIRKVVAELKQAIAAYELTARDLGFDRAPGKKPGRAKTARRVRASVGAPKYRNPASGDTWTGHGRPPAWIVQAKDREAFLIAGGATSRSPRAAKKAAPPRGKAKAASSRRKTSRSAATASA